MDTSILRLKSQIVRKNDGITLVELIIVLALLGFVFSSIFSFYFFSNKIFTTAQKKSDIQHEATLAAEFITKELRTSTLVDISLDEGPPQSSESYNSYIGLRDGYLEYWHEGKNILLANGNIVALNLVINKNSNLLEFHIRSHQEEQEYSIDSRVILLNLKELPNQDISGNRVYYFKSDIKD